MNIRSLYSCSIFTALLLLFLQIFVAYKNVLSSSGLFAWSCICSCLRASLGMTSDLVLVLNFLLLPRYVGIPIILEAPLSRELDPLMLPTRVSLLVPSRISVSNSFSRSCRAYETVEEEKINNWDHYTKNSTHV